MLQRDVSSLCSACSSAAQVDELMATAMYDRGNFSQQKLFE